MLKYTFEEVGENQYKIDAEQVKRLFTPPIQTILDIIQKGGFEIRIVGGAVKDLLIGQTPRDIDLSTNALPTQIIYLLVQAGIDVDTKGIHHGTIKAIIDGEKYEITSLDYSIKVNDEGEPVIVVSNDWKQDAERRDYTINSLSMDLEGNIFNYVNGLDDLKKQIIRGNINFKNSVEIDPYVILRAFKLISRFQHPKISKRTLDTIKDNIVHLPKLKLDKVYFSMIDTIKAPYARRSLELMAKLGILKELNLKEDNIAQILAAFAETENPEDGLRLMTYSQEQFDELIAAAV